MPDPREPGAFGVGSAAWPGLAKSLEEMGELATVLGKLMGSDGDRHHWSGDLVPMIRDEIADVHAALDFLEERNPELKEKDAAYILRRRLWKLALFRAWADGKREPDPERYGLPPRGGA